MGIRIKPGVLIQEVQGEAVLLDPNDGSYFGLNELGNNVVRCLSDGLTFDATVAKLLTEYDVEEAELRVDIETFIGDLVRCGVAVRDEDES